MKPLKKYDDLPGSLYAPIKLLSPEGVLHYAILHNHLSFGVGGKNGALGAWTGFGEWMTVPYDGTWQGEGCRADVFEDRTGLPVQRTKGASEYGSPWYVPLKRSVEVRALMKLPVTHTAYVGAYGRRLQEAANRVDVFTSGLWDIHSDDWIRTCCHAVEMEAQGRSTIEDYLLWHEMQSAVQSWELHGADFEGNWRRPINPDPITAEEVMHLVALTRVWAVIADLRPAIEAERELWWKEIEPWAEYYHAGPAQQELLEVG